MQKELLKEKIKENYEKIALDENTDFCCSPQEACCSETNNISKEQVSSIIGYNEKELKSIPKESILGLGCGAPLNFAELKRGETLVDLGSGAGKAVFTAALYFDFSKSCGIELLPAFYKKANKQLNKAKILIQHNKKLIEEYSRKISIIHFINGNFLHTDFFDANIIYISATCLNEDTWGKLIGKLAQLKPGARIIVATKVINDVQFELIHKGTELMDWGLCPVSIYKRR